MRLSDRWTVADFRLNGCDAEIRCAHCDHVAIFRPAELERLFDGATPVLVAAGRFRCRHCGGRGAAIAALKRGR